MLRGVSWRRKSEASFLNDDHLVAVHMEDLPQACGGPEVAGLIRAKLSVFVFCVVLSDLWRILA
jgi:hypothetical protein